MKIEKPSWEKPGDKTQSGSELKGDSANGGSIFSRNLELNIGGNSSGRFSSEPEGSTSRMNEQERKLYFQLEARKVVDILQGELQQLETGSLSLDLLEDLYRSWKTLWGADELFPVKEYTEMFEIIYSSLKSAAALDQGLSSGERQTLETLLRNMAELASGDIRKTFPSFWRELMEKYRRAAFGSSLQSEKVEDKETGKPKETGYPGQEADLFSVSESSVKQESVKKKENDISRSVNEWFSRVSGLMKKSGSSQPSAHADQETTAEPAPQAAAPDEKGEIQPSCELEEPTGKIQDSQTEPPEEKASPQAGPHIESQDSTLQVESAEDVAPIVEAYFKEQCRLGLDLVRNSLEALRRASPKKISRRLSRQVNEMLVLAEDLGFQAQVAPLARMQQLLARLASAERGNGVSLEQTVEQLHSITAQLESQLSLIPSTGIKA